MEWPAKDHLFDSSPPPSSDITTQDNSGSSQYEQKEENTKYFVLECSLVGILKLVGLHSRDV